MKVYFHHDYYLRLRPRRQLKPLELVSLYLLKAMKHLKTMMKCFFKDNFAIYIMDLLRKMFFDEKRAINDSSCLVSSCIYYLSSCSIFSMN